MTMTFQGLKIHIENPAGSTRKGVDGNGKPWSIVMAHDYGEILGTDGVDGDPVDCFIGPNKSAKWVYVVHQTGKQGTAWDEDKVMLGFNDVIHAKEAYYKNFDLPDHFFGSISTLSLSDFKDRLKRKRPQMIFANKMNTTLELFGSQSSQSGPGIGMQVTVDGFQERGIVVKKEGSRWTVKLLSGKYVSRDVRYIHSLDENTVRQMWRR